MSFCTSELPLDNKGTVLACGKPTYSQAENLSIDKGKEGRVTRDAIKMFKKQEAIEYR